jgi:hypothetical protein
MKLEEIIALLVGSKIVRVTASEWDDGYLDRVPAVEIHLDNGMIISSLNTPLKIEERRP